MIDVHSYNYLWSLWDFWLSKVTCGVKIQDVGATKLTPKGDADNLAENISSLNISIQENLWESKRSCEPIVVDCQDVGATKGTPWDPDNSEANTNSFPLKRTFWESKGIPLAMTPPLKSQDTDILNLRCGIESGPYPWGKLIIHETLSCIHNI